MQSRLDQFGNHHFLPKIGLHAYHIHASGIRSSLTLSERPYQLVQLHRALSFFHIRWGDFKVAWAVISRLWVAWSFIATIGCNDVFNQLEYHAKLPNIGTPLQTPSKAIVTFSCSKPSRYF